MSVIVDHIDHIAHCRKLYSLSMRLIAYSFPILNANSECDVNRQHTGARLAGHLEEVLHCFDLTDGRFIGIATENGCSNQSITCELQSTLEASVIEWPTWRYHIPFMAHVIKLALGAFMSSLSVKGRTKHSGAHECDQQFGERESVAFGYCQRLRKEGNARINKALAMRSGFGKIIEKVHILRYFESPETDLHIADKALGIDYADTWSSKQVH